MGLIGLIGLMRQIGQTGHTGLIDQNVFLIMTPCKLSRNRISLFGI